MTHAAVDATEGKPAAAEATDGGPREVVVEGEPQFDGLGLGAG